MLTSQQVKAMKVKELRAALEERGLDAKGLKKDLTARLLTAIEAEASADGAADADDDGSNANNNNNNTAAGDASAASSAASAVDSSSSSSSSSSAPTAAAAAKAGATLSQGEEKPLSAREQIERKKQRAERFGITYVLTEEDKRMLRAERFGIAVRSKPIDKNRKKNKTKNSNGNSNNKNNRNRNNKNKSKKAAIDPEMAARLAARAQRFGTPMPAGVVTPEEQARRAARAARFGTASN